MLKSPGLIAALCLAAPVHAVEVPAFVPGQRVYLVPQDYAFPTREVLAATSATDHPVYVVVYEQVMDGHVESGHASETEDAIEQVWSTWRTAAGMAAEPVPGGFDGREGNLVLLAMDDREVRVMAGSRWDAELDLHNEALGALVDRSFLPLARAGDYDGGLAALVQGVDGAIEGGLAAAAANAAEEQRDAMERAAAEKRREMRTQAILALIPVGVGGLLALAALLAVVLLRVRALRARRRFEAAAEALAAQLDAADTAFADFRVDVELRDRLVDLRLKGPTTTALYARVAGDLDAIQAGLAGLRRHLAEGRAGVAAGFFAVEPWDAACARLQTRLTVEPARTEGRLFPSADAALEVEPQVFMDGLEARFAAARDGWTRLLDAVETSLHRAEQDLPRARLDAATAALGALGLPEAWLDGHPLRPDPEAAWAALDELRRSDPVAYLAALERALEADEACSARAVEVAEGLKLARARRAAAEEPSLAGLDTVIDAEEGDPAEAGAAADRALAALETRAQAQPQADTEAFHGALDAALAACEAWVGLKKRVVDAMARAEGRVAEAEAAVRRLEVQYTAGLARAKSLSSSHTRDTQRAAWREVNEACDDLEQARAAVQQARARLGERRHCAALVLAERALQERGEAVQDLTELTAALGALEQARTEAEALRRSLDEQRAAVLRQAAQYGSFGGPERLAEGDALREALAAEWATGAPADWAERRERLKAVLHAWRIGVSTARVEWRAEQARQELKLREEELFQAETQRRSDLFEGLSTVFSSESSGSSSSYSSFSSHSHRSSSSSHRSSSSSHRSGGGSFGHSHRSGGSSFKRSGGRSGGRKF